MEQQRPIRVLLIGPSQRFVGGQAVQAERLLHWLGQSEEVRMAFQPIDPQLPGALAELQKIKFLRTMITMALYLGMLTARVWRYDILHVFTASYWSYNLWPLTALGFAKLFRKKIILNYRDGQCEDHLDNWPMAAPTIRMMTRVVTPSDSLLPVFRRHGIEALHIPNVIDSTTFSYRERGKLRPLILHNRMLDPLYNVQCTLRAFGRVQARYPEASLTLAHDGPSRGELEGYARKLGLRNCRFIGKVGQGEIAALYDAHDIYVTTPNLDCLPGSLLECFASGIPIVATRVGGIPFMTEHGKTALLADKDDDAGVAEGLMRLLEEPELAAKLARNGREALGAYSGPRVRDQWFALYRELVRRPSTISHERIVS